MQYIDYGLDKKKKLQGNNLFTHGEMSCILCYTYTQRTVLAMSIASWEVVMKENI